MKLNKHLGINGIFTLRVHGPDGELRRKSAPSENLILNSGLHGLYYDNGNGGSGDCRYACRVGTGSSAPSPEQTALDSEIGYVEGNDDYSRSRYYDETDPTKSYHWEKSTYAFPQGAVVGNISEVGVGYRGATGNTYVPNGSLFSRALIRDENGDPTTITILADEYLFVDYEVRVYPNLNGTVTGTASGYSYKMVYADYLSSDKYVQYNLLNKDFSYNVTGDAAGTRFSKDPIPEPHDIRVSYDSIGTPIEDDVYISITDYNYDPNNFTVIKRLMITPQGGNVLLPDPIKTMVVYGILGDTNHNYSSFIHFVEFDPAIDKDETKALTIDFLLSWGRYTPPE